MPRLLFLTFVYIVALFVPDQTIGAELLQDKSSIEMAQVVQVLSEESNAILGTGVYVLEQNLRIKVTSGENKGDFVDVVNDYGSFGVGDKLYVLHNIRADDGYETYMVHDAYRIPTLVFLSILFLVLVVFVGGVQGVRGLISLIGSMVLILFVLLPLVLEGYSPLLVSTIVSSCIIIVGSYVTHGLNKTTSSAVVGMILTVILTGALAYVSVHFSKFTGFASDEAMYLNFSSSGNIDIVGVLLGGIMIGLLGVLYDVSIGQAIAVEELHTIAPHVSKYLVYKRAIRIGREHIGALVNTLAIAYVGVSLPLLLMFYDSSGSVIEIINREVFSAEIIRTVVGSVGLVLAVPITTLIAVHVIFKSGKKGDKETIKKEISELEHYSHKH